MAHISLLRCSFRLISSSAILALAGQLLVAGPAQAATPTLSVSPSTGPPTQSVTASGTGFAAGQPVSLAFDNQNLASAAVDAAGSFAAPFMVPAAALPGAHTITVVDGTGQFAKTAFTVQTPWMQAGFDAARTGFNGVENELNRERAPGLTLAISVPIGSISSTPAFSGGRLYFGTDAGVFRVAGGAGATWTFTTGGPIHSSPAIFGNPCQSIVFGSDDGKLYRLGCDGTLKWSFTTGGAVRSSPLILNNISTPSGPRSVVYFGSGDGSLRAVDLLTGAGLWSAAFGGAVDSSPSFTSEAAGGGIVVAGSADGTLRAFGASTGAPMWSSPAGGPVTGAVPLATAGGGMPCQAFASFGAAAGTLTGGLASFNCLTGAPLWTHPMDTIPAASPGLLPDSGGPGTGSFKVIVGGANGNIYALERGTGIQIWSSPTGGGPITSGPTLTDSVVYMSTASPAGGTHGDLKIMDGDGNLIGSLPLSGGSPTQAPSAIVNNGLLIAPSGGGLDAYTLQSLWPQFHNDTSKLGYNAYEATATIYNLGSKWTFNSGSLFTSSPIATNGNVYVGSANGNVYALNATTGTFKWIYTTGDWVVAAPAVSGNSLYVGSKDGTFYALTASTGALLWTFSTGGPISAPATVKNGVVYFGSEDHTLYALNAANGSLLWSYTTGDKIFGGAAVVSNVVYFGSLDHNVYALSAVDGSLIWSHTTGGGVAGSPAVTGGAVYVGSYDHYMYALSAASGGTVWQFQTGGWIFSSPAIAYGKVYFGSTDHNIYALDLNGNQVWAVHTDGDVISSPAVANHIVAVGSYDGNLWIADANAGVGCQAQFWGPPSCWGGKIPAGGSVYGSPAIAYGKVIVGAYGGKVIAVGP